MVKKSAGFVNPDIAKTINTIAGTAYYVRTEVEDDFGRWNDNYYTRDGYWVIHAGRQHHVYKIPPKRVRSGGLGSHSDQAIIKKTIQENQRKKGKGWREAPGRDGKAPIHKIVATRASAGKAQNKPMTKANITSNPRAYRLQHQSELRKEAETFMRQIIKEIQEYKPAGMQSEISEALGIGEDTKRISISTPIGNVVFDKKRQPSKEVVEGWFHLKKKADVLQDEAIDLTFSIEPHPNTTTGNYRVVERGLRLQEIGLLSESEIRELKKLKDFWHTHPEMDRLKGTAVYGGNLELKVWKPSWLK